MYKHLLIPSDGSPTADKAVAAGIEFAREAGARVTLFTAIPALPMETEMVIRKAVTLEELERRAARDAHALLAPALERARSAGVDCDFDFARTNRIYAAIIDAAHRRACDAIFMATHGRKGLAALLHGSQTFAVLSHSDIPTMVVHG
jgi:nucleotide-binding universal stress UspA family protein